MEEKEQMSGGVEEAHFRASLNNLAERADSQSLQGIIDGLEAQITALEGSSGSDEELAKLRARKTAASEAQERAWIKKGGS